MKRHTFSFHSKIFIYITAIILVFILLLSSIFPWYMYQEYSKEIQSNLDHLAVTMSKNIDHILDNMNDLSLYLSTDPDVQSLFYDLFLKQSDSSPLASSHKLDILFSLMVPKTSHRYRLSLFNKDGAFLSAGIPYNLDYVALRTSDRSFSAWYEQLETSIHTLKYSEFQADSWSLDNQTYLSLYRKISSPYHLNTTVGLVEVQCPSTVFKNALELDRGTYCYSLTDDVGNTLLLSENKLDTQFTTSVQLCNGWTLHVGQTNTMLVNSIHTLFAYFICITLFVLFVFLLLFYRATKRATAPLRMFTNEVERISLDNLTVKPEFHSTIKELNQLHLSFSAMLDRLQTSIAENDQRKQYELRATLIALQSQMDPHFLYNTLSIIKSLSRENKTEQIRYICDFLVKMLRYISDCKDEPVSLKSELDHCEMYLKLMKCRYEDQFEYSIRWDNTLNLEAAEIVKLSLHPLLENCFQHGFKKVLPIWFIDVSCSGTADHWIIQVKDNGYGMQKEDIAALEERVSDFMQAPSNAMPKLKIGGMGLINSIVRLKLRYKDHFSYKITENKPRGTTITLEGGSKYESDHCGR